MPVAEAKQETQNVVELPAAPRRRDRRKLIRLGLLILGPLVALGVAGEMYLSGGRYVETDNAYVRAPIMNVATDVPGTVANVAVHENQHVEKGVLLFTLDGEPFRIALAGAQAQLGGNESGPIDAHPRVLEAQAAIDKAKRDLDHATILAPWPGTVANVENLRSGAYVKAGQPALSLVASDELWVEANPKETDLTHLKVGDEAEVSVDAYPGVTWKAKVTSLSPATGAEFSVLPPQNASGNWVKVVQRVPVKLAIENEADAPLLTSGMSVDVSIDTGHRRSLWSLLGSTANAAE